MGLYPTLRRIRPRSLGEDGGLAHPCSVTPGAPLIALFAMSGCRERRFCRSAHDPFSSQTRCASITDIRRVMRQNHDLCVRLLGGVGNWPLAVAL
jgi:hypothetical protein